MAEVKLEDIKPNSFKSKEESTKPIISDNQEKVTPVVHRASVVTTKKSLGQKFTDTFVREDIEDVKSWLITDVIVPGIKDTILDMLGMMFFGSSDGRRRSRGRNGYDRDHVSYSTAYYSNGYSSRNRGSSRSDNRYVINDKVDYRNIVLQRRDEAEAVIDKMRMRIDAYGQVSIAEMLDLMEITGKYTDNNWGWTNPHDIGVRRVSNGYLLDVAEAELLD